MEELLQRPIDEPVVDPYPRHLEDDRQEVALDLLETEQLTRSFLASTFYQKVFKPKLEEELERARNARYVSLMKYDMNGVYGWNAFEMALWNIENVWFKRWMSPTQEIDDKPAYGG